MKLVDATTLYMQVIQANGCKGKSISDVLQLFARSVGSERELNFISPLEVRAFLDGNRPLSLYWHRKHSALLGFFRFAHARSLVSGIPLPPNTPRCHQTYRPYLGSFNRSSQHPEIRELQWQQQNMVAVDVEFVQR